MKKYIIYIFITLLSSVAYAQNQKISLADAIQIGLQNRIELKNQQLLIQLAESENDKIKAKWNPQVTASGDARINTQLQQNILPFKFGQNGFEAGETVLKFGRTFNTILTLQAEQKLYDANKKIDQKINTTQVENQKNQREQQEISIKQSISEAYYAAVFNKERIDFQRDALERATTNLDIAKVKFANGTMLESDFNRFQLDRSNAQISLNKALQDYELSVENLAYQMNQKVENMEIADNLASILKNSQAQTLMAIEQRPEIRGEEISISNYELNIQKQKVRNLPTVSAYANYTALQQNNSINPFMKDTWFPYNYLGIKANLLIFDGKQAKLNERDLKIRQQINQNNIEKLKADFNNEAQQAYKTLEQSQLDINETKKNIELAKQIFDIDKLRFEKGVLSLSELKNTEFSLQNAENNYLSSVYNFLVASIKYKKAVGSL